MNHAPLRFSAPDWCFFRDADPATYYPAVAAAGCDAVEMTPPERWDHARAAGLTVLNLIGPGMTDGLNKPENHDRLLPELRQAVRSAHDHGIPDVIVFSGNRDGQDDEEGRQHCRRAFEQVLGDAESAGVTLVFEMLNGFDHADYQADRAAYGFALAQDLKSPAFKVVYDIYHMHRMGDVGPAPVVDNLPLIAHLHVAGSPTRGFPGADQEIDYALIVREVMAAGYAGRWGLEFKPGEDAVGDLARAVQRFRAFA